MGKKFLEALTSVGKNLQSGVDKLNSTIEADYYTVDNSIFEWEIGMVNSYGGNTAVTDRMRTKYFTRDIADKVVANDGYEFVVRRYESLTSGSLDNDPDIYVTEWNIIKEPSKYVRFRVFARRTDGADVNVSTESENIIFKQKNILGQISAKSFTSRVNVKEKYHLDNSGNTDISDKMDEIIANESEYSILYFPSGKYKLSRSFVLSKTLAIIGEPSGNTDKMGTIFVVAEGTSNITVFSAITSNWDKSIFRDFSMISSSYTCVQDSSVVSTDGNIVEKYTCTTIDENVNGIELGYDGYYIQNVRFSGFSGVALNTNNYNFINNCSAINCNKGFVINTDNAVSNLRAEKCYIGYEVLGHANSISCLRTDAIASNSLYVHDCNGNTIDNINFDQTNWAGVHLKNVNGLRISGNLGRVAQYYAGHTKDSVTSEDSYKACQIFIEDSYNIQIDAVTPYSQPVDFYTVEAKSPVYKVVTKGQCYDMTINLTGHTKATWQHSGENNYCTDISKQLTPDIITDLVHVITGNFNGSVFWNGKIIKYKLTSDNDLGKVSCDNILCYNSVDVSTLTPDYLGQLITYNNELYIGVNLTTGGWLNLSSLQNK